jgi:hypothetical protein
MLKISFAILKQSFNVLARGTPKCIEWLSNCKYHQLLAQFYLLEI